MKTESRKTHQGPVHWQVSGRVLVVTMDRPPVNALNVAMRRGLLVALAAAENDANVDAILLLGAGKHFIAGSDVREFSQPLQPPFLPEVCDRIETCGKLVVAVLQGATLGGGLEVALAAHYRLAMPGTRLGFPEVTLGLMPGSGGTQRGPRLMGMPQAIDLMLTGKRVTASQALDIGLVDQLDAGIDARQAGLVYVRALLTTGQNPRPTCMRPVVSDTRQSVGALQAAREQLPNRYRGLYSPARILDALEASLALPFDEGMALERRLFLQCLDTPQRRALMYAFFAEREVTKLTELAGVPTRTIERVGVVGAGTMGTGIATALLMAGLTVTLVEQDVQRLNQGLDRVRALLESSARRGRLSARQQEQCLERRSGATDLRSLAQADLVIEAVFEDMAAKIAVFAQLDVICRPGAILASNTSYLSVNELAATLSRPQDMLGLHFFSPAHIMRLVEVVATEHTAPEVITTAFALARRLKKVPVRAGACEGFIGNRILRACRQVADYLLADGASPYQIDAALRAYGYAMGPFETSDMAGGDIGWASRRRDAARRDSRLRTVPVADRLCERGWFGRKSGRGWYRYPEGQHQRVEDPDVLAIVAQARQQAGWVVREFTDQEIQLRYLAAMINEAARVLGDGVARRPLDVDMVMLFGYGFPRYRGGPLYEADRIGVATLLDHMAGFSADDPVFWEPAPLLVELAGTGTPFASLNLDQESHHA